MKKLGVVLLTLALLCALPVTAFAATGLNTTTNNTDSAVVKGTYVAGGTSAIVYSVDITWGSMEFTYTDASEGTWDPTNHSYTDSAEATWTCADGANEITVTNHSNAPISATLSYQAAENYTTINGTFDKELLELETAAGTTRTNAPTKTAKLTLDGALPKDTSGATIGTVTVTLGN